MKIDWKISKKRGNFRPGLTFTMTLESFEKSLAIHAVSIQSTIPMVTSPHENFCLPGKNERNPLWVPQSFHWLHVPYFKIGDARGFIRLPFRESGKYPEVEDSFRRLRSVYEKKVCQAYGQSPFETRASLDISSRTREQISARVTADRLVSLFS